MIAIMDSQSRLSVRGGIWKYTYVSYQNYILHTYDTIPRYSEVFRVNNRINKLAIPFLRSTDKSLVARGVNCDSRLKPRFDEYETGGEI